MAFGKKKRNFASITAPLSGMVEDLNSYIEEQKQLKDDLEDQKRELDRQIYVANDEQSKSEVTAKNLEVFMDPTRVLVTEEAAAPMDLGEEE